jgi:hypothetical protein
LVVLKSIDKYYTNILDRLNTSENNLIRLVQTKNFCIKSKSTIIKNTSLKQKLYFIFMMKSISSLNNIYPMKKILLPVLFLSFFYSSAQENLVQYVKPIIGTEKMGHTYPSATVPFGAVQLSPETDTIHFWFNSCPIIVS